MLPGIDRPRGENGGCRVTLAAPHAALDPGVLRPDRSSAAAVLLSLGTAVPDMSCSQEEFARIMASALDLKGAALERWRRIIAGSGIQQRHGVMRPEQVIGLSTQQRMIVYEREAGGLAHRAARRALNEARIDPQLITDLIVVSCTGFSAPGVDVALVQSLGLRPTVRRLMAGFMGCFGAISGLRAAAGACAARHGDDQSPIALMVCVELCSLHVRADRDVQNLVASALFGDGAAAAIVAPLGRRRPDVIDLSNASANGSSVLGLLTTGGNLLLPEGREWMTWRITDAGFAMTLAREVPAALREHLRDFVNRRGSQPPRPATFIVHPGGPGILEAANDALDLDGGQGLQHSRAMLRRFGNMSSATVLFVLDEALRHHAPLPATLLAFGPGLTIESLDVLPPR